MKCFKCGYSAKLKLDLNNIHEGECFEDSYITIKCSKCGQEFNAPLIINKMSIDSVEVGNVYTKKEIMNISYPYTLEKIIWSCDSSKDEWCRELDDETPSEDTKQWYQQQISIEEELKEKYGNKIYVLYDDDCSPEFIACKIKNNQYKIIGKYDEIMCFDNLKPKEKTNATDMRTVW